MNSTKSQSTKSTHPGGFFIALAPWVLFTVVDRLESFTAGSLVAFVAAALIAAPGLLAGRPKVLELGAVVTFAGLSVVALVVSAHTGHELGLYARGIAAAALSLIAFGSLLFTPFTEQYAREAVASAYWNSAEFKSANRRLTAMWGAIFAAMVPFHVIAGTIDTTQGNLILNWVVPILLVVWGLKRSMAEVEGTPATA